jgi:hypothetical protein
MDKPGPEATRAVIRDALVFQLKLLVDALRDVVMSPLTLGAALFDLLLARHQPPRLFYAMLQLGRRSEQAIDLWSAAVQRDGPYAGEVDLVLQRLEEALRDPRTGARRARVLRRWAERQLQRQARRLQAASVPAPRATAVEPGDGIR